VVRLNFLQNGIKAKIMPIAGVVEIFGKQKRWNRGKRSPVQEGFIKRE